MLRMIRRGIESKTVMPSALWPWLIHISMCYSVPSSKKGYSNLGNAQIRGRGLQLLSREELLNLEKRQRGELRE